MSVTETHARVYGLEGTSGDTVAPGESLRVTILRRGRMGPRTFPVRGWMITMDDLDKLSKLDKLDKSLRSMETKIGRAYTAPGSEPIAHILSMATSLLDAEERRTAPAGGHADAQPGRLNAFQAALAVPRLTWIPASGCDEREFQYVHDQYPPQGERPRVLPGVWALLTRTAPDHTVRDRGSRAQLKQLGAAALLDVLDWTGNAVARDLGYGDESATYKAAAKGRVLWANLRAWPWACLPPGPPGRQWWETPAVRLGWQLWASRG